MVTLGSAGGGVRSIHRRLEVPDTTSCARGDYYTVMIQEPVRVVRDADVCAGDARIAGTRIPVWILHQLKQLGETDAGLLEQYPNLTEQDLRSAWRYVESHREEIDATAQRRGN